MLLYQTLERPPKENKEDQGKNTTHEGKDPWGGYRVGFEGLYKMTRKDFGMDFNLGPAAEFVDVTLQIEAIRDK